MYEKVIQWTTIAIEMAGILTIIAGAVYSISRYIRDSLRKKELYECYSELRANLGYSILLGLEFLVAADIISTVTIEPSISSVAALGGIVLIRTFLSFALKREIASGYKGIK